MSTKVLRPEQVEEFIELGYTKVEQAFPARQALAAQDFLWKKVEERGPRRDDQATWTQPMILIQEGYSEPVFQECLTERLCDAVQDLVGIGRWRDYRNRSLEWGWWPVNFHVGGDQPWDVPTAGWHWDGIHFKHTVDASDQGLLLLCMFSETKPKAGGTLVAEGSHKVVARFLNQHPQGLDLGDGIKRVNTTHPWIRELTGNDPSKKDAGSRVERFMNRHTTDADGARLRVVETTANPGDIYLCHPFLYHAASPNHARRPRFMCNRTTPLYEKLNFDRPDGGYSPLETSIRKVIGRKLNAA